MFHLLLIAYLSSVGVGEPIYQIDFTKRSESMQECSERGDRLREWLDETMQSRGLPLVHKVQCVKDDEPA